MANVYDIAKYRKLKPYLDVLHTKCSKDVSTETAKFEFEKLIKPLVEKLLKEREIPEDKIKKLVTALAQQYANLVAHLKGEEVLQFTRTLLTGVQTE